jgi:SAM-dependent methyltransferase
MGVDSPNSLKLSEQLREREIVHARESGISSTLIGNSQHQIVGNFLNKIVTDKMSLLEIGCGNGQLSRYLNCSYHGSDPIELPECSEFKFTKCYGENTPFVADSFDVIVIKDGINYYSNLEPLFNELVRIIKPEGSVIFTEYVGSNYSGLRIILKKFIKFRLGLMKNKWDDTYLGYYSHNHILKQARVNFMHVDYHFQREDERYFVSASKVGLK